MDPLKIIVVDDEMDSRRTLCNFLIKYCDGVEIVAEAASVTEAVAAIKKTPPDLVFLDINMPRENGFQLFERLQAADFHTVFVTAYDDYALQAYKHHAIGYILKPIEIEALTVIVDRVKTFRRNRNYDVQFNCLLDALKRTDNSRIALPVSDGYIYVRAQDIIRCEAGSNYTHIHFTDRKNIVVSKTLGVYQDLLASHGFARVHHHHLINLKHVEKYLRGRGGIVIMSDKKEIQVSQRKKEEFLKLMGGI